MKIYTIEVLDSGEWQEMAFHTNKGDREKQKERFLDSGTEPANIRYKERTI